MIRITNNVYEAVKKASSAFHRARIFLASPKQFIRDQLQDKARSLALKMFNPQGELRSEYIETGNEIYKFSMSYAQGGMNAASSGFIREIQFAALEQLGQIYGRTWTELDRALEDMKRFSTESSTTPIKVTGPRPNHQESSDCIYSRHAMSEYIAKCQEVDGCRQKSKMEDVVSGMCGAR